jgi:hypothetical protein
VIRIHSLDWLELQLNSRTIQIQYFAVHFQITLQAQMLTLQLLHTTELPVFGMFLSLYLVQRKRIASQCSFIRFQIIFRHAAN